MVPVVIEIEPFLTIREAKNGEEGFEVPRWQLAQFRALQKRLDNAAWHLVREAIKSSPDHPDVTVLREYLEEVDCG